AFIIPFEKLPAFGRFKTPGELISRYVAESTAGKGKLCFLSYASGRGQYLFLTPAGPSNQLEYDYYCAFVVRTILSLTGKLSAERLTEIRLEKDRVVLKTTSEQPGQVLLRVRDRSGESEYEKVVPFSSQSVSLSLPRLTAGTHFVDAFLKRAGAIVDWRSCALEVPAAGEIKISLEKEGYLPGEIVSGKVEVSGLPGTGLKLTLSDSWGRVVESKVLPFSTAAIFNLSQFQPVTVLHYLRAELLEGKDVLLSQEISFPVRLRFDPKEFFFLIWGGPTPEYLPRYLLKLVRQAGVDGLFSRCDDWETLKEIASYNLYANPYIYSLKTASAGKDLARHPCFSDPAFRERMASALQQKAVIVAPFAPITYGLGDENELSHWSENRDFCFSPHCLTDLREYLKREYGSLAALNAEWETNFSSWEEVRPTTLSQLKARGEKRNFSSWIDHRLHMESVFAGIHLHGRQAIEKVDPAARVGAEGIWGEGNSFTGIDYSKMAEAVRSVGGYGGTWLWRNFLTPDSLLWDWGIYSSSTEKGARYPWEVLLAGGNGIGFFSLFSSEPDYTAFLPDYTRYEPFASVVRETQKIKNGVGRLLLSARAEYSPVVLVHSQPNLHLTTALSETTTYNYQKSRWAIYELLTELWYYPAAVTHRSVATGILSQGRYQAVFLPSLFCLSPEERRQLRLFVEKGGIVMADTLPGLFDGHGRMTDNADMEELFGVTRSGWPGEPDQPLLLGETSLSMACAEKLTLTAGKARLTSAQGYPAFIVRKLGAGQAICFNLLLPGLDNLKPEKRAIFLAFLDRFWRELGLKPMVEVKSEETGQVFPGGKGRFFTCGASRYLFLLPEKNGRVKIALPWKSHLYDIATSTYCGLTDSHTVELDRKTPVLLASLPYRVNYLQVKIPASVRAGEIFKGEVGLKTEGQPAENHVINLSVLNPQGQLVPYLCKNLDSLAGKVSFQIPTALNELAGVWQLQARDVATGVSAEVSFRVTD
ncbi:MAG TPA: beta-galactosidase, partial [bacterium]|nr:beta-galactosidase [bacterium]